MKTNLVEIFQTIRASVQPYTAVGFEDVVNTESTYKLEVESSVKTNVPAFFLEILIKDKYVALRLFPNAVERKNEIMLNKNLFALLTGDEIRITILNESELHAIEETISACFKVFKEEGWV